MLCIAQAQALATPALKSGIQESKEAFTLSVKNISDRHVTVPEIYLSSAIRGGHWIFLYDANEKKLQQGWSQVLPITRAELPRRTLAPGESMSKTFLKKELLEYFMHVPKCFYLTSLFRKRIDGDLIYSRAAPAIYHCEED